MSVLALILTVIVFIAADYFIRTGLEKRQKERLREERRKALDIGLRLEFSKDTPTLKRVEVSGAKASIIAVDDEAIILDSFRKILVLEGYNVDTVETGPEALTLLSQKTYDFVFTDLKMPNMDGVEVTKAAKHLRPDADVIIITGYATVESAVETMKHGAMDYVQKPFTEDELVSFVNTLHIRRKDRIEKESRPTLRMLTVSGSAASSDHEFNVGAGIFLSPGHTWVSIEPVGTVKIGLDDFAVKVLGKIDGIETLKPGDRVQKGQRLFTLRHDGQHADVPSPVSGIITSVNQSLLHDLAAIKTRPFEHGWICTLEATQLPQEMPSLRLGAVSSDWYQQEIDRYMQLRQGEGDRWEAFTKAFLGL